MSKMNGRFVLVSQAGDKDVLIKVTSEDEYSIWGNAIGVEGWTAFDVDVEKASVTMVLSDEIGKEMLEERLSYIRNKLTR